MPARTKSDTPPPPAIMARTMDACHMMKISRATLHRLVKAGKIRKVQIGPRAVGFRISDIDAYLASATAA